MEKAPRNSSIELLRLLCMIGVIILHYNNPAIGGGYNSIDKFSTNYFLLHFLESVFIIAVDTFLLITGYFMSMTNKRNLWKPIELIVRVMAYSVFMYLLVCIFGNAQFSAKSLIGRFIPANYFVILYCTLFLISPYINFLMQRLGEKNLRIFVALLFALFAVYPTAVDLFESFSGHTFNGLSSIGMYGSQWGYCIVNFSLMYVIGAYIKLKPFQARKSVLVSLFLMNSILLTGLQIIGENKGMDLGLTLEYCNPLVIVNAILAFKIFEGLHFTSKIVNFFAAGSFSVFLLHGYFLGKIRIDWATRQNVFVLLAHVILTSVLLYLICSMAHYVYELVTKPIFRILQEKIKIPVFDIEE